MAHKTCCGVRDEVQGPAYIMMKGDNAMDKLPEEIFVSVDQKEGFVKTDHYVKQKTKDLRGFGYSDLKKETVEKELLKILNDSGNLTAIGMFIKGDIKTRLK